MNDYITFDGLKYKVAATLYQPTTSRQRTIGTGLTGKTIVQDFTTLGREPREYAFRLRVYTATRGDGWGHLAYLRDTTYPKTSIPLTLFDGTTTINVVVAGDLKEVPRVPANIAGANNGITYVDVLLRQVHA